MPTGNRVCRIAIATQDGIDVNEHFGRAESFTIAEINDDGTYTITGKRDVKTLCGSCDTEEGLLSRVEALSDCTAVLVAKIGGPVRRAFEINGISVFEQPDRIENALEKLAEYYTKTAKKNGGLK